MADAYVIKKSVTNVKKGLDYERRTVQHSKGCSNLTNDEFKGYCKGMSIHWLFKALGDSEKIDGKRVAFWDEAHDKYKHHCKNN